MTALASGSIVQLVRSLAALLVVLALPVRAQSSRAIAVSVGLGIAAPSGSNIPGSAEGVYAQGQYILWPESWFTPRLYAGLLTTTKSASGCAAPCDLSAHVVFAGGKVRLMAPFPYVGPYFELGLGASLGNVNARVGNMVNESGSGLMVHVPVTLGLALGKEHGFDVEFTYLFHPVQSEVCGAVAVGLRFDLE